VRRAKPVPDRKCNIGRWLTNRREFVTPGQGFHDGTRADVDGTVWAATAFDGEGVDGIHAYHPDSTRLRQIEIPEGCTTPTFVGKRRNRLFICGSQSVYTLTPCRPYRSRKPTEAHRRTADCASWPAMAFSPGDSLEPES